MGATGAHDSASAQPGTHKTHTVDYIILLSGQVSLILDDGAIEIEPMDVVIQRAPTTHGSTTAINPPFQPAS